jgi:hypothetical protein
MYGSSSLLRGIQVGGGSGLACLASFRAAEPPSYRRSIYPRLFPAANRPDNNTRRKPFLSSRTANRHAWQRPESIPNLITARYIGDLVMNKTYTWEYRIDMAPYEKLVAVVEAFFCSYSGGDYNCEHREQYKLCFRRGQWKKAMLGLGSWAPAALVKGQFNQWPIVVNALIRPSPQSYRVTLRYELHLPFPMSELHQQVQTSVDQHIRHELDDLSAYLAECASLPSPPPVVPA